MFLVCHPEDAAFASEGSGRAARAFAHSLRKCEIARSARILKCHCDCNEGGKSSTKYGQTRVVRAVCRAFGSVFHRLLFISFPFPRPQLSWPLCTTSYHILPVSRLLSSANLKVRYPLGERFGKVRVLVVNHKDDHNGLGLRSRFLRYLFAKILLAFRAPGGVSCGKRDRPQYTALPVRLVS